MMSPKEAKSLFKDYVVGGTVRAPNNYPDWHPGWQDHRAQLLEHWQLAKTGIKHDLDAVSFIDQTLAQAIESFDKGEKEPGQSLMVKIYNALNMGPLR
jgi:hypothetical protein